MEEKKKDEGFADPHDSIEPFEGIIEAPAEERTLLVVTEGDKVLLLLEDGLWGFVNASFMTMDAEGKIEKCIRKKDSERLGSEPEWLFTLEAKEMEGEDGEIIIFRACAARLKGKPLPGPDLRWVGADELDSLKLNPLSEPFKDTVRIALTRRRYAVALGDGSKDRNGNLDDVRGDLEIVFEGYCLGIEAYDKYYGLMQSPFFLEAYRDARLYDEDGCIVKSIRWEKG